jgi:hypothetical protein
MYQIFLVGSISALFLVWQIFATAISQDTKIRADLFLGPISVLTIFCFLKLKALFSIFW